ncbi:MAG TPA: MFS transporter [Thermoguttaceae bacterium]|nr:MFS transporter [Thermoguttaceae bacterium]
MEFDVNLYVQLSLLMFFEFAVWGAWCPVLAARCLGPLKMTGKQTGWIYATLPLASMITPIIAGWLSDSQIDAKWLMAGCHLVGAILLFVAAKQQKFWGLFFAMFGWSLCYAATLPLVNKLLLAHHVDGGFGMGGVFIWAPVAWALVGYLLAGLRNLRKVEGGGGDCLVLAAVASLIMFACCLIQPITPFAKGTNILDALALFEIPSFVVFMAVMLVVAGMQQFYFLGSAPFMQDIGIKGKNVSAVMAIAQAVQALATWFLLERFFGTANEQGVFEPGMLGPTVTLAVGAFCWAFLFLVYVRSKSPGLIIPVQAFHGFAYVFFIIAGQIYTGTIAPPEMAGSAQGMIFFVQAGLSLFLCTQLAGVVMDKCSAGGKFQWSKIFAVPLVCAVVGAVVLLAGMKDPESGKQNADKPAVEKTEIEKAEEELPRLTVTLPGSDDAKKDAAETD